MSRFSCPACGAGASEFDATCRSCAEPLPDRSLSGTVAPAGSTTSALVERGELVADRFRVEAELGRGGMGIVLRAHDVRLDVPCALKILLDPMADEATARFEREARLAARLKSRHVVSVLDHGVHGGRPFIAMELLEGETLAARLARVGRLDAPATAAVIDDLARGLAVAHAAGVVHRDLKPENVFLVEEDGEEVAKILDFGIARPSALELQGSTTASGALLGTPRTMSPEQAAGARDVDHRADLWSLAVVAFRCLTGRMPFEHETLGGLIGAIQHAPIPVPSEVAEGVPPAFDSWWSKAAARDRSARFSDARVMASALEEALLREPTPAAPDASPSPGVPRAGAWPGLGALVAAALCAVALAVALLPRWAPGPSAASGAAATFAPSPDEAPASPPVPSGRAGVPEQGEPAPPVSVASAPIAAPPVRAATRKHPHPPGSSDPAPPPPLPAPTVERDVVAKSLLDRMD